MSHIDAADPDVGVSAPTVTVRGYASIRSEPDEAVLWITLSALDDVPSSYFIRQMITDPVRHRVLFSVDIGMYQASAPCIGGLAGCNSPRLSPGGGLRRRPLGPALLTTPGRSMPWNNCVWRAARASRGYGRSMSTVVLSWAPRFSPQYYWAHVPTTEVQITTCVQVRPSSRKAVK